MTSAPQCCSGETTLNEVANLMVEADCGEIPVTDSANRPVGVITDRDIVCRVVAKGKDPSAVTASECMTQPVVCVNEDTPLEDVLGSAAVIDASRVEGTGPDGRLPLTAQMLRDEPSGNIFGLTQNAGMGWRPDALRGT